MRPFPDIETETVCRTVTVVSLQLGYRDSLLIWHSNSTYTHVIIDIHDKHNFDLIFTTIGLNQSTLPCMDGLGPIAHKSVHGRCERS